MGRFRLEFHEGCTCQACLDLIVDAQGKKLAEGKHTPCKKCHKRDCGHALDHTSICTYSNAIEQLSTSQTDAFKFAA